MELNSILYVVCGNLALGVSLSIFLFKDRRTIRVAKMINDGLWMMNYFFQGSMAYTGAVQNAICLFRDFVFWERVKEKRWANSVLWCLLFSAFYVIMPFVTWQGWYCILPACGSILSTTALYVKREQMTRWLTMPAQVLCLVYSVLIHNTFSILGNAFLFASALSGLILEHWRRQMNEAPAAGTETKTDDEL